MKFAFAGNRDIAVRILEFLISNGYQPELLMITDEDSDDIRRLIKISNLPRSKVFIGSPKNNRVKDSLEKLNLDYIFGIHYPYIISDDLLKIPKYGFLNLHPAYLPYNRGWHTPSWVILDKTPAGATLHKMSKNLDLGDIIHRRKIDVPISDTADSLYSKLKDLEFQVFKESFDAIQKREFNLIPQNKNEGTSHKKEDLLSDETSRLYLDQHYKLEDLIDKLRALTTNTISEACYFEENGKRYRLQLKIEQEID